MNDFHYDPSVLPGMVATTRRQRAKDTIFVETLVPFFLPGPILEIGAGCGQLTELLSAKGRDVTASDIQPFLVDYMTSHGLRARLLDATNLAAGLDRPYDNILAQSISVLITPDLAMVQRTYESIHEALPPEGRFIFILPSLWGEPWSHASDHLRIAKQVGFDLVHRFRHQILPSRLYGHLPGAFLRAADGSIGRILGIRVVFVFERRRISNVDPPLLVDAGPGA
jgi:SAM-dependent methyltransferase